MLIAVLTLIAFTANVTMVAAAAVVLWPAGQLRVAKSGMPGIGMSECRHTAVREMESLQLLPVFVRMRREQKKKKKFTSIT
jgi:hypothetical protein